MSSSVIGVLAVGLTLPLLVGGCAQTAFYPVCVYGGDDRFVGNAAMYEDLEAYAEKIAGPPASASISTNRRILALTTTADRHRVVRTAWPEAACLGPTAQTMDLLNYKQCIAVLEQSLARRDLPPLGNTSDGINGDTLFCRQTDSFGAVRS